MAKGGRTNSTRRCRQQSPEGVQENLRVGRPHPTRSAALPYLHVLHLHACALLAHKDVVNVHQDVAVQRQREALAREEGHSVHEDKLVQPEVEVVAEQHALDAIVEAQVLDHGGVQCGVQPGVRAQVRDGLGRARLGQQHWLVGGVVGLEHSPVLTGQHALLHLAGPCHVEQRGPGVDATVLQAQVRVQEQGEAFELCTQQAVLVGLQPG